MFHYHVKVIFCITALVEITVRGQRHPYEVANKYVFKCRLKVDSDVAEVTNDGRLFHARSAATGKARSPIVLRRVTGTTTAIDELERKRGLRLVSTSAARVMLSAR